MGKKFDKTAKSNAITYGMVVVAWLVMMALQQAGMLSSSTVGLLVPVCIYSIMAVSLNLTVGILGDLSLGQAGFMCVGAFASALFTNLVQDSISFTPVRFTLAILVGALVAGVFGLLIGIPVLRLSGDYLAIVTLAFGEIIKNFLNILYVGKDSHGLHFSIKDTMSLGMEPDGVVIIKGAQGITGTSRDATFTIGIILLLISLFIVLRLIQSRDGRAIRSIRDNRIAAESIGINITKYKLLALTVSAAIAGMAGALYAHNYNSLAATSAKFGYNMSIMILVYVVLGGIGNIRGSVIAATLLYVLPEKLRFLQSYRMLIYAIVLIVVMLFSWSPKARDFRERYSLKRLIHKNTAKEAE
ncbi:MAG: branched-chain amino acid ABC transporter permease [Lachnospiraceae bacterium]|nr:branched-chain amino acid ABC transporter permease [Lachnospiraceae bacterium]